MIIHVIDKHACNDRYAGIGHSLRIIESKKYGTKHLFDI